MHSVFSRLRERHFRPGRTWPTLRSLGCGLLLAGVAAGCHTPRLQMVAQPRTALSPPLEALQVPAPSAAAAQVAPGYQVEMVLSGLNFPSSVEFDDAGNLYVAEAGYVPGEAAAPARILRVQPSGELEVLPGSWNGPITDLLWHNGRLLVSHRGKISALEQGRVRDLVTDLPSFGDYSNNQLAVGPDGRIYVGIGAASNAGVVGVDNHAAGWLGRYPDFHDLLPAEMTLRGQAFATLNPLKLTDEREGLLVRTGAFQPFGTSGGNVVYRAVKATSTILRFEPDGTGLELYAWGLRNPYGLAWSPDGRLFAADNGYDERGSRPIADAPDVIWNIQPRAWYGFPDFAAGIPVTDPRFRPTKGPAPAFLLSSHPPVETPWVTLPAHSGAGQMDFSRGSAFGSEGQLFVAQPGDFQPLTGNKFRPAGFQVARIDPATGRIEVFFRARENALGPEHLEYVTTPGPRRPVDVRFTPSGDALYVADLGAILVYPSSTPAPRPFPGSGVIWRIKREGTVPKFPAGLALGPSVLRSEATPPAPTVLPAAHVLTPTGRTQPEREYAEVADVIARWRVRPRELARQLIAKYGPPQEITAQRLIWHRNGPWKRTELVNEEVVHHFPSAHSDLLQQFIDYEVPAEKQDELAKYAGSVVADRTKGELSSRCDREEANFLALNLAHEIITGRRSVRDARRHCAEAILELKHADYKAGFLFPVPASRRGDPDEPYALR